MFTPSSPQAMKATDCVVTALEGFEPRDQLAAGGWKTIAVLAAIRSRFERTPEDREASDLLCSETLTWLRREVEKLRTEKAH